jgi:hypothetical protein
MIFFPDLFTPYMKGRETAIAANWNDRAKYHDVYQAELDSLERTLDMDIRNIRQPGLRAAALGESDAYQKYGHEYYDKWIQALTNSWDAWSRIYSGMGGGGGGVGGGGGGGVSIGNLQTTAEYQQALEAQKRNASLDRLEAQANALMESGNPAAVRRGKDITGYIKKDREATASGLPSMPFNPNSDEYIPYQPPPAPKSPESSYIEYKYSLPPEKQDTYIKDKYSISPAAPAAQTPSQGSVVRDAYDSISKFDAALANMPAAPPSSQGSRLRDAYDFIAGLDAAASSAPASPTPPQGSRLRDAYDLIAKFDDLVSSNMVSSPPRDTAQLHPGGPVMLSGAPGPASGQLPQDLFGQPAQPAPTPEYRATPAMVATARAAISRDMWVPISPDEVARIEQASAGLPPLGTWLDRDLDLRVRQSLSQRGAVPIDPAAYGETVTRVRKSKRVSSNDQTSMSSTPMVPLSSDVASFARSIGGFRA